jgi:hypothetical protein
VQVIAEAHHCFDMPGVDVVVSDPVSHRGAGGEVRMLHNEAAMLASHQIAVRFFSEM